MEAQSPSERVRVPSSNLMFVDRRRKLVWTDSSAHDVNTEHGTFDGGRASSVKRVQVGSGWAGVAGRGAGWRASLISH